jgi:eukaryotic-like serine/threonine-protein kinase
MTDDRWPRVKSLFEAVLDQPPAAQSTFLAAACADDESLRREVEALLAADGATAGLSGRLPVTPESLRAAMLQSQGPSRPDDHSTPALAAGRRLGSYEVMAPLGAGGMGEVYRARDLRLHRDVALKVLPRSLVSDPDRRERFVQEARAASALEHPHIAVVHDIVEVDGITFIVMELVRGEALSTAVSRGPVPASRAIELAVEIAEALGRAHEIGVVHRDLKPANIMITADGHVKIIDFGIAKLSAVSDDEATTYLSREPTASGMVVGTAAYMSPEQAQGETVDHRTDIFSFGIVLHEMLTGLAPFRRRSGIDTMHAIVHDAPPRVPDSIGEATDDVQLVIDKCLAKAARDRYQTMRDVVADLRTTRRRLESGELRAIEGPSRFERRLRTAAAVGVSAALTIAAVMGWSTYRARREADRNAAIAHVKQLLESGRFVDVWRAVQPALRQWPGDPQLDQMLRSTTMTVTIATDPPGADVAFTAYDDVSAQHWTALGTSPLTAVRAPLGMLRWKVTKNGYEPIEARLEVGTPAAAAGHPDVEAPPIRLRPVGSEFSRMVFVPGGIQYGVPLTDYWLDQTEVTNRDFKKFVERGGYEHREYWTRGGREPALDTFRDRTGRAGPATWELGTYAEGRGEYPVSGVSWFEAVAYCESVGKTVPTVSHWRRAFGQSYFIEVVTVGNFGGQGPEPVTRLKDVGPFGTYGMAGNVKEWVWNERGNQHGNEHYILGGAWNEPIYMATAPDALSPQSRTETNGFRCMKETAPSAAAAYEGSSRARRDYTKEKPVDASTFEIFRRFYSVDRAPLDARTERTEESGEWRRERVSFAAAYGGERVLANILIPKNTPPPYQSVIWFPGSYALALKHTDGDLPFSYYFDFLPQSGRAVIYPVYKGTYERSVPVTGMSQWRDEVIQWSKDLTRTIDYLGSRADFDKDRIAYYGFSMGANDAIPVISLEPRLKTAVLLAGGLEPFMSVAPEIDSINFAPRITTPVLLLAGRNDFYFGVETSQKPLMNLLGTPAEHKRHVIFENAGHVPPRLGVIREVLAWLDRYLGPVEHR